MISRQNKYFFLSAHFLEDMNSNFRTEHRCPLTKPITIIAMSKNQQKKPPVYSKGIRSQSKLTPHKPQHRNVIVSHDLCSLSRLYRVLQIPCLPLKAIKFLALLGVTKALTMKTCLLHSCWVCSLADWNKSTTRGVNFPHLTHLRALVCEGPSLNFKAISKSCLCTVSREPAATMIWRTFAKPLSAWKEKSLFSSACTQEALQVQLLWTILIAHKTEYPYLHKSMSRHLDETWVLLCYALYKHLLHGVYNLHRVNCT